MEAEFPHRLGIEQVSPIEHNRGRHFCFHDLEVDIGELGAFCRDDECLSALHRIEG